jgi:hypothetical protein
MTTIFEAHYLLNFGPIYDNSFYNLGNEYNGNLGLNLEAEIHTLNCF